MENRRSKKALLLVLAAVCVVVALTLVACNATTIQKVKFKVTFDVDGVSYYEINTQGTEVLQMPADPTKEGFIFDGWFWDKDTWTRPFTANSLLNEPLKEDMRIYAKWKSESAEDDEQEPQIHGTELSAKTLTVDGKSLYAKLPNATETFSFTDEIVVADGATYAVHTDMSCSGATELRSKIAELKSGDNVFYILVTNGDNTELYTATIRRRPIYSVMFNTNGGERVSTQYVEEDDFATEPDVTPRKGYKFEGWNYDFSKPIVRSLRITASWIADKYKITYVMNGGTDCNNVTEYTIADGIINLNDGIGEKLFCGWYLDDTFETYIETINCNELKDYTLYALFDGTNGLVISNGEVLKYDGSDKDVSIPARYKNFSITKIGDAFNGCAGLASITIPDSVESIDSGAFSGCSGLTEMTIPFVGGSKDAISAMSSTLFGYIFGTSSYEGGVETMQYYGDNDDCPTYYIPRSLRKVTVTGGNILNGAFYNCGNLMSIIISDSVTNIGKYAFAYCSGLMSVTIGSNVQSIEDGAFSVCYRLVEVYNKSSLNIEVGSWDYGDIAFYAKNVYTSADGSKLTTINDGFIIYDNSILVSYLGDAISIIIPDNVTSINDYAFYECELTSVVIPNSVENIGEYAFWKCRELTSMKIGNSVTNIDSGAFGGCSGLVSVIIPDSVENIDEYAFSGCSGLTSIMIGNLVTSIGRGAFEGCSELINVTIGKNVTSIGDYAFSGCSGLTSVTIPDSVVSIGYRVFEKCSGLTSMTIGKSVTSIGSDMFDGCRGFDEVYYHGTAADWAEIDIDRWNNITLINATKYYYSEEEPPLNDAGNGYNGRYWHYVNGVVTVWVKEN